MISKNKESKFINLKKYNIILTLVIIIYIIGLYSGCFFTFKNADNYDFVKYILLTENILKEGKEGVFQAYMPYIIRDIIIFGLVLVFKYSGVQKGLILSLPFILSVQNSCIYSINIYEQSGIFKLLLNYILKDTAVVLILLIYLTTVFKEILNDKYNIKKDIKKLCVYLRAVSCVYIIFFSVKLLTISGI